MHRPNFLYAIDTLRAVSHELAATLDATPSLVTDDPFVSVTINDDGVVVYSDMFVDQSETSALVPALALAAKMIQMNVAGERGYRDPRNWRRAATYVANGRLRQEGIELPDGAPEIDNATVEQVYEILVNAPVGTIDQDQTTLRANLDKALRENAMWGLTR
jgi:hypothetical protein